MSETKASKTRERRSLLQRIAADMGQGVTVKMSRQSGIHKTESRAEGEFIRVSGDKGVRWS
jgi:hypothetical protein